MGKTFKIETLDNIISDLRITEINILVMDIEGYEYFPLKGREFSADPHRKKCHM
jgi:hypothetical protein